MTSIAIGTLNETKIEAVAQAAWSVLDRQFEITCQSVPSGVSDQPLGLEEITAGASNRASRVLEIVSDAEIGIGLEGGLVKIGDRLVDIGVAVVLGRNGIRGLGLSPGFALPASVADRVNSGAELSVAVGEVLRVDTVATRDCSDVITHGHLPASQFYGQAAILALLDYSQQVT